MTTRPIQWVRIDDQAHIVRHDRYLDYALCGAPLAASTLIFKGDELIGCPDCIVKYAEEHNDKRPDLGEFEDDWGR
jgi:hypothetical protein